MDGDGRREAAAGGRQWSAGTDGRGDGYGRRATATVDRRTVAADDGASGWTAMVGGVGMRRPVGRPYQWRGREAAEGGAAGGWRPATGMGSAAIREAAAWREQWEHV
ncbi:hypothetical protein GUJ93_ZPchr0011g27420 [Zizania palustris]|uniref:Uncharacterized protein n=1 Tax=Zizania palustris TaxID=103762 RepID=A0A8J6BS14_ZIZPA|nr:hypothetical protein GUJ93_ZPchr0011g27420 [Zizania palustris]